jgi:hypothetical protein
MPQITAFAPLGHYLTAQQCREMQRVVLHWFMEVNHDPLAAKEVLDVLGIAYEIPMGTEETEPREPVVSLLWNQGEGLMSRQKRGTW